VRQPDDEQDRRPRVRPARAAAHRDRSGKLKHRRIFGKFAADLASRSTVCGVTDLR